MQIETLLPVHFAVSRRNLKASFDWGREQDLPKLAFKSFIGLEIIQLSQSVCFCQYVCLPLSCYPQRGTSVGIKVLLP